MIRWTEDLGAPAVVALADAVTAEQKPTWNRPVGIGLAAIGYIFGGVLGKGGGFVKNLGIAAAPWAFQSIYQYIKEGAGLSGRAMAKRPVAASRLTKSVGRYPAPAFDTPFEGVKLV